MIFGQTIRAALYSLPACHWAGYNCDDDDDDDDEDDVCDWCVDYTYENCVTLKKIFWLSIFILLILIFFSLK